MHFVVKSPYFISTKYHFVTNMSLMGLFNKTIVWDRCYIPTPSYVFHILMYFSILQFLRPTSVLKRRRE